MINKKIIDNVFTQVIYGTNLTTKCGRDYIISRLNKYTSQERQLLMKDKLNDAEYRDYYRILNNLKNLLDDLEEETDEWFIAEMEGRINKYKEMAYQYEKRIVLGYNINNNPPSVNIRDFGRDDSNNGVGVGVTPGNLEQKQVDSQSDIMFSDKEVCNVKSWSSNDYRKINGAIYKTDAYTGMSYSERNALDKRLPTIKKHIDSAIGKSKGLTQDTVFYRGGHWDIHLNPGDKGKWKGYTSLSYNESEADKFRGAGFKITCLVKGGVKGLALNDKSHDLSYNSIEHEYLLPRNTEYTVVSVDYESRSAVVLIEP